LEGRRAGPSHGLGLTFLWFVQLSHGVEEEEEQGEEEVLKEERGKQDPKSSSRKEGRKGQGGLIDTTTTTATQNNKEISTPKNRGEEKKVKEMESKPKVNVN
jgi:hypothetical protein